MTETTHYPSRPGIDTDGLPKDESVEVPKASASSSVEVSRARLRSALMGITHPPPKPPLWANGLGGLGGQLLDRARSIPGAAAVYEGVQAWWRKHPVRKATHLAATVGAPFAQPIARRNPGTLLLVSAGIGALLVLVPLRRVMFRLLRPALLSGLLIEVVKAATRHTGTTGRRP